MKIQIKKEFVINRDSYFLEICTNKNVLHIGACDSPFTYSKIINNDLLHKKINDVSKKCIGIDIDNDAINICKDHGINNIKNSPIEDIHGQFNPDIIIFGETIEHVLDIKNIVASIAKVMNKNTILLVSTPNAYSFLNFINCIRGHENNHPDHVLSFTPYTLLNFFKNMGLKQVEPTIFTFLNNHLYGGLLTKIHVSLSKIFPMLSSTLVCKFVLQKND